MSYCTECIFRNERVYYRKGSAEFSEMPIRPITTNTKGFCFIGYTQNPLGKEATENVLKNNGVVCDKAKLQLSQ